MNTTDATEAPQVVENSPSVTAQNTTTIPTPIPTLSPQLPVTIPQSELPSKPAESVFKNKSNKFEGGEVMLDRQKMKEHIATLRGNERRRAVALLHCFYSAPELSEILGVKVSYVHHCANHNRFSRSERSINRNMMIAEMTEHKVAELLQGLRPEGMEDRHKAQAIKQLMEAMDLAKQNAKKPEEGRQESVTELIFRVRKRMKQPDAVVDAIDVTSEITEGKADERNIPQSGS